MIIINRRFDHAFNILNVLCEITLKSDTALRGEELAQRSGVSVSYMEQIVRALRDNDLIISGKGPGGGYAIDSGMLGRSMESVYMVLREKQEKPLSPADRWILGLMRGQTVRDFMVTYAGKA